MFDWMAWTTPVAVFFTCIVLMLIGMTVWKSGRPPPNSQGLSADPCDHAGRPPFSSDWFACAAYLNVLALCGPERAMGWFQPGVTEPSVWISFRGCRWRCWG